MILIGSRALAIRAPHLLVREPVDFDWVCTKGEFDLWLERNSYKVKPTKIYQVKDAKMVVEGLSNCEFELIQPDSSSQLLHDLVVQDSESLETSMGLIPSLDLLFTIKRSHRYLKNSPHFWKTALDYHLMQGAGAKVRPEYKEFLKLREKETYTYKHPNLNQSKKDFFSADQIKYVYDHDTVHESVAVFERPAYTYYMQDGSQVKSDKAKFLGLPKELQLAGVVEEAAVLAIERSLVPHPGVWTPKQAWKFALSKVCTSITSGWFRAFAYDNLFDVLKRYPEGYWEKFQVDVEKGLVKPFQGL